MTPKKVVRSVRSLCRKLPIPGSFGTVWLSSEAYDAYKSICVAKDELSVRRKTALDRYFLEFCQSKLARLNDKQFKKEETFSTASGKRVAVYAFKVWKWRLYGALLHIEGVKAFVGVRVDADKKQDKADRALMSAAAQFISELDEHGQKDC